MPTIPISEIMTPNPRTVQVDDSVSIAEWLLALDEIHHVVVVDDQQKVVGIISDRDIMRAVAREATPTNVPVGEIMSRDVQTIAPDAPAAEAIERMVRGKFHALPVTDSLGHLMGIVTAADFLDVARWVLKGLDDRLARDGRTAG